MGSCCRAFHISEDVFAGYNHTLRGAQTKFLEYISVGKGRDMGFDSINSFESKVPLWEQGPEKPHPAPLMRLAPSSCSACNLLLKRQSAAVPSTTRQ